jgi:hypothetical protein
VEEGHFVFNNDKSRPLVWLGRIPTVGSKCASWVVKSVGKDYLSWPLEASTGAGAGVMLIGLNGPYSGIEGCQVTILMHVLSILVDIWGIKCTLKVPPWAVIFGQNREGQWTVTTQRVVWSFFFKMPKRRRFGLNKGVLSNFN